MKIAVSGERLGRALPSTLNISINYFRPVSVKPTSCDLSAFPCFDSEAIEGMKSELKTYLAAAQGVAQLFDPCEW